STTASLSLHDALPILSDELVVTVRVRAVRCGKFGLKNLGRPPVWAKHERIQCYNGVNVLGCPVPLEISGRQCYGVRQCHERSCLGIFASWPRKYCGSTGCRPRPRRSASVP